MAIPLVGKSVGTVTSRWTLLCWEEEKFLADEEAIKLRHW